MIRFDPKTLTSWKEKNIREISITITDTGCAGHKIQVAEGRNPEMNENIEQDLLQIYLMKKDLPYLDGSMITWTGKKWILTSDTINIRCGCGSSFSFKSGSPIQDKIAKIKLAIKEMKEGIHP